MTTSDKILRVIFGSNSVRTQAEVAFDLRRYVDKISNGQVGVFFISAKELGKKFNNCINKDDMLFGFCDHSVTEAINSRHYNGDLYITDNWPFACLYLKKDKEKFLIIDNSVFYFTDKDENGRPIKSKMIFKGDAPENSLEAYIKEILVPRVLDPEKWAKEEEEKRQKKEAENRASVQYHIEVLEKELNELKKLLQ